MMYGQLVAADHGWAARDSRPVIRLRRYYQVRTDLRPALEVVSRAAVGAAVGGVIGVATVFPVFWLGLGATMGVAIGALRDRAQCPRPPR